MHLSITTQRISCTTAIKLSTSLVKHVPHGELVLSQTRGCRWQIHQTRRANNRTRAHGTYNVYGQPVHERVAVMSSMGGHQATLQQPQGLIHGVPRLSLCLYPNTDRGAGCRSQEAQDAAR